MILFFLFMISADTDLMPPYPSSPAPPNYFLLEKNNSTSYNVYKYIIQLHNLILVRYEIIIYFSIFHNFVTASFH